MLETIGIVVLIKFVENVVGRHFGERNGGRGGGMVEISLFYVS